MSIRTSNVMSKTYKEHLCTKFVLNRRLTTKHRSRIKGTSRKSIRNLNMEKTNGN